MEEEKEEEEEEEEGQEHNSRAPAASSSGIVPLPPPVAEAARRDGTGAEWSPVVLPHPWLVRRMLHAEYVASADEAAAAGGREPAGTLDDPVLLVHPHATVGSAIFPRRLKTSNEFARAYAEAALERYPAGGGE